MINSTAKRKRNKISTDSQAKELIFFESECKRNIETNLKTSFISNELGIIRGKMSSWLKLVSNSSLSHLGAEYFPSSLINKELLIGIIITRRITNLPIRYTNMPGSTIPNLFKDSLYSISERFPCTPLNSDFENENCEKISFQIEKSTKTNNQLEEALFGVINSSESLSEENEFFINKKRKKEAKANVDFLKQKLSIFPGNIGREYLVFQKYDEGIILDADAVMDATPEILAQHIARRLRGCTILDACGGVGGNTIAFSQHCKRVISVEISSSRTHISKHNSQIYKLYGNNQCFLHQNKIEDEQCIDVIRESGSPTLPFNQSHRIDECGRLHLYFDPKSNIVFVNGDIFDFCDWYRSNDHKKFSPISSSIVKQAFKDFENFEWAFASPPWGGYSYNGAKYFNLENNLQFNYKELIIQLSSIADNIALFLPRNTNPTEFPGFLSLLGFQAIEIEAIRDTRFNYIMGLVIYSVRTKSKFKLRYLFGQDINLISNHISAQLISFTESIIKELKLINDEHSSQQNIPMQAIKKISKFGKKVEKLFKKKGLEPIIAFTYLFNFIVHRDENYTNLQLLNCLSNFFSVNNNNLANVSTQSVKLKGKYNKYIQKIIKKLEK